MLTYRLIVEAAPDGVHHPAMALNVKPLSKEPPRERLGPKRRVRVPAFPLGLKPLPIVPL
jgi:hypothetical protein